MAALAWAPSANAATSCVFDSDPPGVMDISMASVNDSVTLVKFIGELDVDGAGGADIPCMDGATQPTADNVGTIHVTDASAGHTSVTIYQPASFAPAAQPNPLNPKEIEFDLNFAGAAGEDDLVLYGEGTGADFFRAGASGIDVNAGAEQLSFDSDITFSGSAPDLTVILQGGNDTFTGQGVDLLGDTPTTYITDLNGGEGGDTLTGGSGIDAIEGNEGADTLDGALGTAGPMEGGTGDDHLESGAGSNALNGGADSDTVTYTNASGPVEASLDVVGPQSTDGSGVDTFTAIENLTGSPFDDFISGDEGDNVLDGAGGTGDQASYESALAGVTVSLGETDPQATGGAGTDTLSGFESLNGGAFADTLGGDVQDNDLDGLGGLDTVTYAGASAGVAVNLENGSPQDTGGAGTDTLADFDDAIGSPFGDTLRGDLGVNSLAGGEGDDTLDGGAGGNDDFEGGQGADTVTFASCGDLTCDGIVASLATGLATDTIGQPFGVMTSIENLTGSAYPDELTGSDKANVLRGANGDDKLIGALGKDTLKGEDGLDKLKAKDGRRDRKIDCGPGANSQESARFDKDKDPTPKSC